MRTAAAATIRDALSGRRPAAWATMLPGRALTAVLVAAAALAPAPCRGQENEERGWLGIRINLEESRDCDWESKEGQERCRWAVRIHAVQEDGPAAAVGIVAGDRILAIDGREITLASWPRMRASIRPMLSAVFSIARGEDRYSIGVTPGVRPPNPDQLPWIWWDSHLWGMTGERADLVVTAPPRNRAPVIGITLRPDTLGAGFPDVVTFTLHSNTADSVIVRFTPNIIPGEIADTVADLNDFLDDMIDFMDDLEQERERTYRTFESVRAALDYVNGRLSAGEVRQRASQLAEKAMNLSGLATRFRRAVAGAEFEPVRDYSGHAGLLVLRVAPGTATARLGLVPGDLLIRGGERPLREVQDLIDLIEEAEKPPLITWIRGDSVIRLEWHLPP